MNWRNLLEEALVIIEPHKKNDPASAQEIAEVFAKGGDIDRARGLAARVEVPLYRAFARAEIAAITNDPEDLVLARHDASTITTPEHDIVTDMRSCAYAKIAGVSRDPKDFIKALEIAQLIRDPSYQGNAHAEIAAAYARAGEFVKARELARSLELGYYTYLGIARVSKDEQDINRAIKFIDEGTHLLEETEDPHVFIIDPGNFAHAANAALVIGEMGFIDKARLVAAQIDDPDRKTVTFIVLWAMKKIQSDLDKIMALATDPERLRRYSYERALIAQAVAQMGQYEKAYLIAQANEPDRRRAHALILIASELVK